MRSGANTCLTSSCTGATSCYSPPPAEALALVALPPRLWVGHSHLPRGTSSRPAQWTCMAVVQPTLACKQQQPLHGGFKHGVATTSMDKANRLARQARPGLYGLRWKQPGAECPFAACVEPDQEQSTCALCNRLHGGYDQALAPASRTNCPVHTAGPTVSGLLRPQQVSHFALPTAQQVCHLLTASPAAQRASLFAHTLWS